MKKLFSLLILSLIMFQFSNAKWEQIIINPTNYNLYDVCNADSNISIAVGKSGFIRVTQDGGYTWTVSFLPGKENLISISCRNKNMVFILSDSGNVYKSEDLGKTWSQVNLPVSVKFNKVKYLKDGLFSF